MSLIQNISNAETDALALSSFLNDNAQATVPRRIAGNINTLQYYIDYLNTLKGVVENPTGTVTINGTTMKTIAQAVKDALDTAGVQNGVSDSLVAVTNSFLQNAVARTQADKNSDLVSVKDFGAKGDGTTDDTQAVKSFINVLLTTGKQGYVPSGVYPIKDQIVLDMGISTLARNQGFRIVGDGLRRAIFKSSFNTDSPFVIINNASVKTAFYPEIENLGLEANAPFPVLQIGKRDFSDEINAVKINVSVNNSNTSAQSCGLELNGVYQGVLNVTCNTGATSTLGDALRIRQGQFLQITGSGGNAATSIHFVDGYSYANVITNWDAEEVKTCIKIDSPNASSNTFIGGQMSWSVNAINATAGSNNIFINPNFGLSANRIAGNVGIMVTGQGKSYGTAFQPMTVFSNPLNADSFNRYQINQGYRAGQVWQINNNDRFMIDSDGNILVARVFNSDLNRWLDAYYIDTAGVTHINQAKVDYFGLGVNPTGVQTVTGSKGGNVALASLIKAMANFGLIIDSTT